MTSIKLTTEELWSVLCSRIEQNQHNSIETHLSIKEATQAFLATLDEDIERIREKDYV